MTVAYNVDCMEYMKTLTDGAFDLAVVDPPYGDAGVRDAWAGRERFGGRFDKYRPVERRGGQTDKKYGRDIIKWDVAPPPEYFDELRRVAKHVIIWGGNYFALPPTRCFLVWHKTTISEKLSYAMAEYAWTDFNANAKVFEYPPQDPTRFHPTQKPVALYRWIYRLFTEPGQKILDTHLGSGSSRIAAHEAGLDFVGCEIDKNYFDKQEERFAEFTSQISLFYEQEEL